MDNNDLKERDFEAYIEHWLTTEGGYTKGNQATYDKERAIDLKTLIKFIRLTQTKKWELYEKKYGAQTEERLYNVLQDKIHERGLIWVLRNGIEDLGFKFKLVYFEPASPLNEELNLKYEQNIMECTRQFAYSTKNHDTIDMVLSVNGIPVVALELKNQLTGQNVENSRHQWMNDRDFHEELFQFNHRILAYFGVDLYEAIMATHLLGEKTFFMPFNQGSNGAGNVGGKGNPEAAEGKNTTSYLWERVLNRRMLLCILQRYISRQEEERISIYKAKDGSIRQDKRKSIKIIFPRYHQLDVVEKLLADTAEHGSGKNYLIQHSAGSGKSNSIAWVAYRLGALQNAELKPMFNCVFVITDRRVLNSQLQKTILGFDHVDGTVETVKDSDPSTKLRNLINDDNSRIIICTLHRFPLIYNEVKEHAGKRYALIVDEAHSSQTGKSAEKVLLVMQAEFAEIQPEIKPYPIVADWLVKVIAAETAPSMDGANDVLQNAFNRLYCSPRKVAFMDKKSHFRSLVSYFEVFLKKIYFIENGKEMAVTRERLRVGELSSGMNARPGEMPALGDCIYQTPCLKRLKYESDSNKFKTWLQQLRDWCNEQSHQAPIATEEEYDAAIHIVTALYLYVTAYNIKWLQPKMMAQLVSINTEHEPIGMAAERA